MTGKTLAHYRVLEKIGQGGMGVVYRARDERLNRDVALKVLSPSLLADETARRRFRKEALALSQLNHPNIATIYDFDTQEGVDFLVMELIPGQALSEKLAAGPLAEKDLARLGAQMAAGLEAAHRLPLVHRDLKPGNLRITPDGWLKILDFGLARPAPQNSASAATQTLAETHTLAGTLPYMAPEQLRAERVDARADLWAAGAVLYEMTAGRRAFPQEQSPLLIEAILHQPPAALPEKASAGLQAIILKALDKDPERRYQSARELQVDLERLGAPVTAPVARPRGRRWIWAGAAVLLVMAAWAVWWLRGSRPAPGGRLTLAVLPFHTQAAPAELRFLGVGIPDAIITRLAGVGRLLPRPTSSILRYENQTVDPKEAGQALAADYVLTGMVQPVAERLRVSVQLVRVSDGDPVWGKQYDLPRADLLTLQDSIAEQLAEALQIQMTAPERARLYRRYTENRAAYELYLRGRSLLPRSTREGTLAAVEAFEAALRLDPNYALAHAGLAQACALIRLRFSPEAEVKQWEQRAEREAHRALELDPKLAEAHEAAAAVYRAIEYNWERTIEESRLALEINPNLDQAHYYRAAAFYHMGLLDLVEPEVKAALDVNPAGRAEALRSRGLTALWDGRFREALPLMLDLRRITDNTFDWFVAQPHYYLGEQARAEQMLEALQLGVNRWRARALLASYLAARGERARADALVRAVLAAGYMDHHIAYSLGAAYAHLGGRAEARRWLQEAARTGLSCYPWYQKDPLLHPLREDPEFQSFLAELRQSWEAARARRW